ncbi:hypothetical protein DPMN_133319 [Dreissena polymorpha]|uniref:Uncharacterized protein n=1 Tax=Dreissena polymorpha TaxID=45954 RepID=A0A9D4J9N4_DREPO|nr:hypothetical protein DPMN_133319 [Dreissena polymorpha]
MAKGYTNKWTYRRYHSYKKSNENKKDYTYDVDRSNSLRILKGKKKDDYKQKRVLEKQKCRNGEKNVCPALYLRPTMNNRAILEAATSLTHPSIAFSSIQFSTGKCWCH